MTKPPPMNTLGTILLVDDSENDIFLFRIASEQAGLRNPLQEAHDGEQAIAYLKGEPPFQDRRLNPLPMLMLLDLKMPKKSGFEVLAWLRTEPVLRRLPVFILSASLLSEDIERAFDLGASAFLFKPSTIDELAEMVRTLSAWLRYNHFPELK
jgi:CheY-like chemotaxis protein